MIRMLFLAVLALVGAGAVWYLTTRFAGRPFVSDTAGKVLVALTLAGLFYLLFGTGFLWG